MLIASFVVLLIAGVVQFVLMVGVVSDWVGSGVLAFLICIFGVYIPLPWFVFLHWYLEGVLPWAYIVAFVVGWGPLFLVNFRYQREQDKGL